MPACFNKPLRAKIDLIKLGEHTTEVLTDWLCLDAAAVEQLRQDGIV